MRSFFPSFFPSRKASVFAGLAVAALLAAAPALYAQAQDGPVAQPPAQTSAPTAPVDATLTNTPKVKKPKITRTDRVQQTKDTKAEVRKIDKYNVLLGKDEQLPDKQLYDKALAQEKSGHYDIARLDLQTLLNTYPDSQYQMRSKLAVADCWYREGGTAALTQAEQEYKDFITFFPNAPEAAEAQMRVGDIYFKQMDVPDRDYTKATHAEEEYRTMLKQYPDAPKDIIDQARQKLREVQEMLATRESELAAFYATHANWPASIARYQTVIDTYPQYSHMDDALIGMGDAYETEANVVRNQPNMPEGPKAKLEQEFDGKAAAAYRQVVLLHAAAPHVEDAKERLAAMNLPIPTPTAEQVAASDLLEGSRAQYTMTKRLQLLFLHTPDTVTAAQAGDPPLEDPAATVAPTIVRGLTESYRVAFGAPPAAPTASAPAAPAADAPAATPAPAVAAPAVLSDVPAPGYGASDNSTGTMTEAPAGGGSRGTGVSVEVLTPGVTNSGSGAASSVPAATGAQDPNNGLPTVGPKNSSSLAPIEKPTEAPDQVNDLNGVKQPATPAQTAAANGKKTKAPAVDSADESSSKKKPKKGLDKINPF